MPKKKVTETVNQEEVMVTATQPTPALPARQVVRVVALSLRVAAALAVAAVAASRPVPRLARGADSLDASVSTYWGRRPPKIFDEVRCSVSSDD
jgi:hypothetical protein